MEFYSAILHHTNVDGFEIKRHIDTIPENHKKSDVHEKRQQSAMTKDGATAPCCIGCLLYDAYDSVYLVYGGVILLLCLARILLEVDVHTGGFLSDCVLDLILLVFMLCTCLKHLMLALAQRLLFCLALLTMKVKRCVRNGMQRQRRQAANTAQHCKKQAVGDSQIL